MPHYNLTIIISQVSDATLVNELKKRYRVLLVDKNRDYRNTIKTKDGYIVILNREKKNIEIATKMLIDIG